MTKSIIAIAALICSMHQPAIAEQRPFETYSSGFTTKDQNGGTSHVSYELRTAGWIDPASMEISYSSTGTRTEKVLGFSSYNLTFATGESAFANPGFATTIIATVEEPSSGASERNVDLSLKFFNETGERYRGPVNDFNYHFVVTGEWSLSALLSSDSGFSFNRNAHATVDYVEYEVAVDYWTDKYFWTGETLPPIEMSAVKGSFISAVPEPATYAMLGAGVGLMAIFRRKRRSLSDTSLA